MEYVSNSPASAVRLPKWQAVAALALGLAVVFAAGFATPSALHNATHDTRHAFGLPCH
ncbi:CbtB domain-containing protein [Propylenella binzhouense]|uniref:CbtB-domain containing protein n=1 Tax=Propylenella binzhouense TaxID=2555902 RepID=A0A964T7F9_9HYPH|nr:CbtB domain-containing protein [Propylenella binzhouense]MYZ49480.1 CbtB-domain containing protein [Propylenella binzhouense]